MNGISRAKPLAGLAEASPPLQPLDRPRTAENIAALLHEEPSAAFDVDAVRDALHRLVDAKEFGLVELRAGADERGGAGFVFLSDEVQPIQKKRDAYDPLRMLGVLLALHQQPQPSLVLVDEIEDSIHP